MRVTFVKSVFNVYLNNLQTFTQICFPSTIMMIVLSVVFQLRPIWKNWGRGETFIDVDKLQNLSSSYLPGKKEPTTI